jgi:hypothetical protein
MSGERMFEVAIPLAFEQTIRELQRSALAALDRHGRAPIGDRTDANRLEHIEAAIDEIAFAELDRTLRGMASSEVSELTVRVVWPFVSGPTAEASPVCQGELRHLR